MAARRGRKNVTYKPIIPKSNSFLKKPISEYIFAKPSRIPANKNTLIPIDMENIKTSYIDSKQIEPYVKLRTIDELFDSLQKRIMKDSPFVRNAKQNGVSLLNFMNFFCESWIKTSNRKNAKTNLKERDSKKNLISIIKANASENNSHSLLQSKKAKISNFAECIKMYKDKERIKKLKQEFKLNKAREEESTGIVNRILDPKIPELNIIKNTKELFKCFYLNKQRLRNEMINKLNCTTTERGFAVRIKKDCLNKDCSTIQNMKNTSKRLGNY